MIVVAIEPGRSTSELLCQVLNLAIDWWLLVQSDCLIDLAIEHGCFFHWPPIKTIMGGFGFPLSMGEVQFSNSERVCWHPQNQAAS